MPIDRSDLTQYVSFGATKGIWATLGLLAAIVFSGFTWWLQTVHAEQSALVERVDNMQEARVGDRERLTKIEAQTANIQKEVDRIGDSTAEINRKIDTFLLQSARGH